MITDIHYSLSLLPFLSAILIIETVAFGVVRIRGESSGLYLCMNKRGHVVARVSFCLPFCSVLHFISNKILNSKGQFRKTLKSLFHPAFLACVVSWLAFVCHQFHGP